MDFRKASARVFGDPCAYKPLNLGECARVRKVRKDFVTYRGRAREIRVFSKTLEGNKEQKPLRTLRTQ
jgi:hypothetical protein